MKPLNASRSLQLGKSVKNRTLRSVLRLARFGLFNFVASSVRFVSQLVDLLLRIL